MEEKWLKVLSRLQAQCVRREYCVRNIRAKALKAVEGDAALAEEMVASLVADRFVDDRRYAEAFAREKASLSGWGATKIAYALSGKGVARETIREALDQLDTEAASRKMEAVLAAKCRLLAQDPQGKLKLLRFALSRGYGYDEVREVVDRLWAAARAGEEG